MMKSQKKLAGALAIAAAGLVSASAQVLTPNENFVTHLLQETTRNETPSASEVNYFTGLLGSGLSRQQAATGALTSTASRTALVTDIYNRTLQRAPGNPELSYFLQAFQSGGSEQTVWATIQGSSEYFSSRGSGNNNGFVNAVYQDTLGRSADTAGLSFWTSALGNGVSRSQMAQNVFMSNEGRTKWTSDLFEDYLHRPGTQTEVSAFANNLGNGMPYDTSRALLLGSNEFYGIPAHSITPVPEPQAFASVAGLGLIGLAMWRQRRSTQAGS